MCMLKIVGLKNIYSLLRNGLRITEDTEKIALFDLKIIHVA